MIQPSAAGAGAGAGHWRWYPAAIWRVRLCVERFQFLAVVRFCQLLQYLQLFKSFLCVCFLFAYVLLCSLLYILPLLDTISISDALCSMRARLAAAIVQLLDEATGIAAE